MTIEMKVELRRLKTYPASINKDNHHHQERHDLSHAMHVGELHGLGLQQYTSLRDLISTNPSMWPSPSPKKSHMLKVELKDALLKQAARAYLLPTWAEKKGPKLHFMARYWKSFVQHQGMAAIIINTMLTWAHACASLFTVQPYKVLTGACSRVFGLLKHKTGWVSGPPNAVHTLSTSYG
eukprot:c32926_g1_i1 orf=123-662(+)